MWSFQSNSNKHKFVFIELPHSSITSSLTHIFKEKNHQISGNHLKPIPIYVVAMWSLSLSHSPDLPIHLTPSSLLCSLILAQQRTAGNSFLYHLSAYQLLSSSASQPQGPAGTPSLYVPQIYPSTSHLSNATTVILALIESSFSSLGGGN